MTVLSERKLKVTKLHRDGFNQIKRLAMFMVSNISLMDALEWLC